MLALLLTIVTGEVMAQNNKSTVKGVLYDVSNKTNLSGAVVVVKDTNNGDISNSEGEFAISGLKRNEEVVIEVSFTGYETKTITVKPTEEVYTIKEPIEVRATDLKLKDVTVIGSAPVAKLKGDTVAMSAGAYKTNPDATAGDLIAKMPGFEQNDDGTVSSQGEQIARIYVDGKSFFKDDLATALSALSADMVDSIELFEDQSDESKFTGFDNGDKVKTINIVTKMNIGNKPASLFEASLQMGTDGVYMGSLNYTRVKGDQQISILGGSNNININPTEQKRGFGRGGDSGGVNTQTGVAVNFTDKLKNDGEINVSYKYDRKTSDITKYTNRIYFPTDSYDDYSYMSYDTTYNTTNTHKINLNLTTNLNEKTRLTFKPNASISYSDKLTSSYNTTMMDGDTITNWNSNSSTPNSYSFGGNIVLMRKFTDMSFLIFKVNGNKSVTNTDTYIRGETNYNYADSDEPIEESQYQMSDVINQSNTLGSTVEFTQRVSAVSAFSAGHTINYNWSENDKKTYLYDEVTGSYSDVMDTDLSNDFVRDYITNTTGVRYNYKKDDTSFKVDVKYRNDQLANDRLYPSGYTPVDKSFNSAVITGEYKYSYGQQAKEGQAQGSGGSFSINYKGAPGSPSVTQLQDLMNDDNPLSLSFGNPELDQSYTHTLKYHLRGAIIDKSLFWGSFGEASYTLNGIVNSTTLVTEDTTLEVGGIEYDVLSGAQYTTYANMSGYCSARIGGMFSFPINKIKSKMNIMMMYNYLKQPSLYNGEEYFSNSNTYSLNTDLNSNISTDVDFSIRNRLSYRETTSTGSSTGETYLSNNFKLIFYANVYKGVFISTEYSMTYQNMSNADLTQTVNLLNGSIGKKFLDDKLEVKASIYDALNENTNISQTVSDIYIAESITNNLSRYISIGVTYKINTLKKDFGGNNNGPGSGRGPGSGPGGPR